LAGFEMISPAVVLRVAEADAGCFSLRAGQFIARLVKFEILWLIKVRGG
jgi:hypothetical protein